MTKAVALLSGGLDSTLAVKVVQRQGIEVEGVNFITPFFSSKNAEKAAESLDIKLHIVDITAKHLKVVKNPKYGYGKNMNPCIDCHALMIKEAGRLMEKVGASFIITGEVLGERPKSQNKQALWIVEKESGFPHTVLRPLSAKLLPATQAEEEGLVGREKLLAVEGRSRKPQIKLAKELGVTDYPAPAGGCLLTDSAFSGRLRALLDENKNPSVNDIELLKVGRHFKVGKGKRIVVGRNEEENQVLLKLAQPTDLIFKVEGHPGPTTVLRGRPTDKTIKKAAHLTARYGKARLLPKANVSYHKHSEATKKSIQVEQPAEFDTG